MRTFFRNALVRPPCLSNDEAGPVIGRRDRGDLVVDQVAAQSLCLHFLPAERNAAPGSERLLRHHGPDRAVGLERRLKTGALPAQPGPPLPAREKKNKKGGGPAPPPPA